MDRDAYQATHDQVVQFSAMVALIDLGSFLEAMYRAETLGPILDPTLYRTFLYNARARHNLEVVKELAEALLKVKRIVEREQARGAVGA